MIYSVVYIPRNIGLKKLTEIKLCERGWYPMLLVSLKNLNSIWNFLISTFEVAIKVLVFIWLHYQIRYYDKTSEAFSVVRSI